LDNFDDIARRNVNSAGEGGHLHPDPIIQARDDPTMPPEGARPTDIVPRSQRAMSVVDAALVPNQFGGATGPVQAASSMTDLIKSVLRFKWTMLVVFVLVATPAIAWIWTQTVLQYRARGEVRVRPIIPRLVFRTEDNGMIPLYTSFVNTQVAIMRSPAVLQRVLDRKEVQETQWYTNPKGKPALPPMERLRDTLSVRPRRGTEIIDVSFLAPIAEDAKVIVNTVLEQYTKYIGEISDATEDKLYKQLETKYKSLEREIQGQETTIAGLRASLGTGTPEELVTARRLRLDETKARLDELRQNIALLEWQQAADSNELAVARSGEMEGQPPYHEDADWRRLDVDVRTRRHQIASSLLTPKHPGMVQMTDDLKFAEELLQLREAQLGEQWRNRPRTAPGLGATVAATGTPGYGNDPVSLKQQLSRAKQEEKLLIEEYKKQQEESEKLFASAQLLQKANNALAHKRDLFNAVRQRRDQKTMERNVEGSIEVLTRGMTSSKPHEDRRIVFTAMALVMGLGMGGGLAFLRAFRSQTIYAAKDMPHSMQVPFLGNIPVTRTKKTLGRSLYDEVRQSQSRMIESVRLVRTALLARLDGHDSTTVLVTSAAAGTGKSSFTRMLGKSLAQAGKKVLMIDADFRKMALTKRFDLLDKPGFIESLTSRSVDEQNIFPTDTSGLKIMPAGVRGDDGALFEETANGAFKACIGQLRNQFNIILLDSSPILPVADAAILSSQVDGTIMVERELVSRRANVVDALARLGSAGGRLLGTVFVGSSSHEGYGYDYYYSRTSES